MSLIQLSKPVSVLLPPPIDIKCSFHYRGISMNNHTNRVYIVDDISHQVYVYSLTDYKYLFLFKQNLFYPIDITAKQKIVAVTSYSTTILNVFTLEGNLISSTDIKFISQGITEDSDGGLHVCVSQCIILLYNGEVKKYGLGLLDNPYSIACYDKMSYVLHNNAPCLAVFDNMGVLVAEMLVCGGRKSSHNLMSPRTICCDAQGNLVVSDYALGGVVVFDSKGSVVNKLLSTDGVLDERDCDKDTRNPLISLKYSEGVDMTANGDVIVSCNRNREAALIIRMSD